MNKINHKTSMKALVLIIISFSCNLIFAQCNTDAFIDKCAEDLMDYTYVRLFDVNSTKNKNKTEYSVIFNKDHEYLLIICSGSNSDKKMIVDLLDRNKKLIQSSFIKQRKLHVTKIAFKCTATGVYYIESSFEDNAENCGVVVLGFKKL